MRWRVWLRHTAGVETYLDVTTFSATAAIADACAEMRRRTHPPMRGWYVDRWQLLAVLVGKPNFVGVWDKRAVLGGYAPRTITGPPLRRRLRVALRRLWR